MFNTKTVKINIISIFELYEEIQCVPKFAYSSRFITYAPSFMFLGKLSFK